MHAWKRVQLEPRAAYLLGRDEVADHEPNMHLLDCKRKNDVVAFINFHLATAVRALVSWP